MVCVSLVSYFEKTMRTNTIRLHFAVLAFTGALMCATSNAQQRDVTPQYSELHEVTLLGFPGVIRHLVDDFEVSEKDAVALAKIGAVRKEHMQNRKNLYTKMLKAPEDKFQQAKTRLTKAIEKSNSESWTKAEELLKEKQIARLRQIRMQRFREDALLNPKIIDTLKISDAQIKAIEKSKEDFAKSLTLMYDKQRKEMRAILSKGFDRPRMIEQNKLNQKAINKAKDAFESKVYKKILKDEQRKKFMPMRGEKFELAMDWDLQKLNLKWRTESENETTQDSTNDNPKTNDKGPANEKGADKTDPTVIK